MTFKPGGFEGKEQFLVTSFVRAVDSSLRCYERARTALVDAGRKDSLIEYLKGCDDLEVAVVALNRAMRLAEALRRAPATAIGKGVVPPQNDQRELSEVRNAIDHNVDPILDGEAGEGLPLSLGVTENAISINRKGTVLTVTQAAFGEWMLALHELATTLAAEPRTWKLPAPRSAGKGSGGG